MKGAADVRARRAARSQPGAGEALWHDIECGAYSADLPLWQELVAAAVERSGPVCELLEVGCGTGRVSLELAAPDCHVTAVDIDPELVAVAGRRARERDLPVDAVVANACSLELDSAFDLVLAPMQVAQLLGENDRIRMLSSIRRHLHPEGRAAVALLDLDEEWDADAGPLPPPDSLKRNGWVYSSQPVAVRRIAGENTLTLDRVRRITSPEGDHSENLSRTSLELVTARQLSSQARRAGLVPDGRRQIAATQEHVASTVVLLKPDV